MESPEDALTEYAKILRGYTADELEMGWDWLLQTYKRRDWPTVLDLREAIKAARPARVMPYVERQAYVAEPDNRTPETKERVRRMFAVLARHKGSETQYSDTAADPEYLAICAEIDAAHEENRAIQ